MMAPGSRPAFYVFLAAGIYLLLAIEVADRWEKVAVLRFGRHVGLRRPGLFHVFPSVDRLSRFLDQRIRVASSGSCDDLRQEPLLRATGGQS